MRKNTLSWNSKSSCGTRTGQERIRQIVRLNRKTCRWTQRSYESLHRKRRVSMVSIVELRVEPHVDPTMDPREVCSILGPEFWQICKFCRICKF
jgi:hypothetical protein